MTVVFGTALPHSFTSVCCCNTAWSLRIWGKTTLADKFPPITTTNCEKVEMLMNDKSMGIHKTENFPNNTIIWYLPYTPGKLVAKGFNGDTEVANYQLVTSKETTIALITPDRTEIIKDKQIVLDELKLADKEICGLKRIQMVACGSAYHVCMSAKYIFEQLARIPVDVDLASELRYRNPVFEDHTLAIVVSQSGETADTLAALREAKSQGLPVMGIVNVVGSSIAREADYVFYTWAGPEIAVATTKAYSAQLAAVYLLAIHFGRVRGNLDDGTYQGMIEELLLLPDKISRILEEKERIQWFANKFSHNNDVFFIGRGLDYAASMEGSLKLKEISYIHSEAYAAGELKHGTISLIEDGIWTINIATQGSLFEKLISNMVEVKSRGANILGITSYGNYCMEDTADCTIYVPKTLECFYPSLVVIPLQLLAYYVSLSKGLDVDKPRNLAKSVTVE